jgi:hypothetical protein
MIYGNEPLGQGLVDIQSLQRSRLDTLTVPAFQWNVKYLPVVIGFFGVVGIALYVKRRKKRGKK